MDVRESDFGLFQTTVRLQDEVRRHTEELEAALGEPERGPPASPPARLPRWTCRRCAAPRRSRSSCWSSSCRRRTSASWSTGSPSILEVPVVLFDTGRDRVVAGLSAAPSDDAAPPRPVGGSTSVLRGPPGPATSVVDAEDERILLPRGPGSWTAWSACSRRSFSAAAELSSPRASLLLPPAARHARAAAQARRAEDAAAGAPRPAA